MQKTSGSKLNHFIDDHFSPEWKLLSETENFVSHTPEFPEYEQQFKTWRKKLQSKKNIEPELITVRSEIVTLRKTLRLKGYDLSLGLQQLIVKGFRNDDAMAEGFKRVVLCFCDPFVYFMTGSANHVEITENLYDILNRKGLLVHPEMHYLWYRRKSKDLYLSGSATESEKDFERLAERAQANPMKLLASLKDLT